MCTQKIWQRCDRQVSEKYSITTDLPALTTLTIIVFVMFPIRRIQKGEYVCLYASLDHNI